MFKMTDESNATANRVSVADKRIIRAQVDVNQLVPIKHKWAWEMYLKATETQWMPAEIDMSIDMQTLATNHSAAVGQFRDEVWDVIDELLGFNNLDQKQPLTSIYRITTSPECRQFLLAAGMLSTTRDNALRLLQSKLSLAELSSENAYVKKTNQSLMWVMADDFTTGTPTNDREFMYALTTLMVRRHVFVGLSQLADVAVSSVAALFPGTMDILQRIVKHELTMAEFYAKMIVTMGRYEDNLFDDCTVAVIHAKISEAEREHGFGQPTQLGAWICQMLDIPMHGTPKQFSSKVNKLYGLHDNAVVEVKPVEQSAGSLEWD